MLFSTSRVHRLAVIFCTASWLFASAAHADDLPDGATKRFSICNLTGANVRLAIAYWWEEAGQSIGLGWIPLKSGACTSPDKYDGTSLEYYAEDAQSGRTWGGDGMNCINTRKDFYFGAPTDRYCYAADEQRVGFRHWDFPAAGGVAFLTDANAGNAPSEARSQKLTLCNDSDRPVRAVVGYQSQEANGAWMTEGSWFVDSADCQTLERSFQGDVYVNAYSYGDATLVWDGDKTLCTNSWLSTFVQPLADRAACEGESNRLVGFRKVTLSGDETTFRFKEFQARRIKSTLRICNETDAWIDAAWAFPTASGNASWTSYGWGQLSPQACFTMANTDMDRAAIYGRTNDDAFPRREWRGDQQLCILNEFGFALRTADSRSCEGQYEDKKGFRPMILAPGVNTFTFRFED